MILTSSNGKTETKVVRPSDEFYGKEYHSARQEYAAACAKYPNVTLLDKGSVWLEGL